ncbi:MAG TPA: hypothetical protein VH481_09600 [Nitrososphaeraceae archaeon]
MNQHSNRKAKDLVKISPLLFAFLILLFFSPTQFVHNLMILAYDSKAVNNALSEGGQICPLDSKCDKQNDNQTDTHNMTLNVPNSGKSENGQGSVASSILINSNGSQNQTNLGNTSSLNGEINNSIRNMINITTDKQIYNPGEKVNISIKNIGVEQLTFPNSALGLTIRNLASKELYPILSSQVITILSPGDSKSLEWDQMGNDGNQAPSGNYSASVKSGINSAETTFTIK